MHKKLSTILGTLIVVLLFILAEILAHKYSLSISDFVKDRELLSQLFFVLMAALAIIIPVWSNMFLIPIAVVAFGSLTTALLCITGWWIGGRLIGRLRLGRRLRLVVPARCCLRATVGRAKSAR